MPRRKMRSIALGPGALVACALVVLASGRVFASEPTDEEVARVAVELLLGNVFDFSGEGDQLMVKPKIGPKMTRTLDRRAGQLARRALEKQGKKIAEGPVLMCLRENYIRGDQSKKAKSRCYRKMYDSWPDLHSSVPKLGTRLFYFDALIDFIQDPEFRSRARHMMAFRLGWQPVHLWHQNKSYYFLAPTPMRSWSRPIIETALLYAKGDGKTTAELRKAFKQAKPHSCVWRPGALVREAKWGNKFGKVIYDSRLKPKPYIIGSGGEVDCTLAQTKKKDPEGMAPVRKVKKDSLIAVETVEGQDWVVNRNALGKPTSKTRIVRIYQKVPKLPPRAIGLDEFKKMNTQKKGT